MQILVGIWSNKVEEEERKKKKETKKKKKKNRASLKYDNVQANSKSIQYCMLQT